jgi:4-amino-4-deoxy-L-arabinose transferase-like glycosyltransferase
MSERMRWSDFALLAAFCLVLCSFPLFSHRVLTTHETVHCQNAREMRADGDWIIPHYGGRPWTERPPLPFWITNAVVEWVGDTPVAYRLAALLMGVPCVLLAAWMAGVWYGRGRGLLAGLILATMQEFTHYCTGPEADIFLCTIVTGAIALFVHLEFQCRPALDAEDARLLGRRPWALLAFFIILGLTNQVKGLFFGAIFVLLPTGTFLLAKIVNRRSAAAPAEESRAILVGWHAVRHYFWLWGWLAFLVVGAAWPVAAYLRYPDILEFWQSDYLGRVNQGYMREPFWYYFAHLPWLVFPWTVPALFGLWITRTAAWRAKASPERFLWCWAVTPILFFSIPQGKHHHYLLQCLTPWSILAALGTVRLWQLAQQWDWLRQRQICAIVLNNGRAALAAACVLLVAGHWLAYDLRTTFDNHYREDSDFLLEVQALTPPDKPLLVMDDDAPLNASWLLFYLGDRATLLHNVTFLLQDSIQGPEVYLLARRKVAKDLARFGTYESLAQSEHSRYEETPADRYTLFRLRFYDHLARHSGAVRISPMQATGRAAGPFLVDLTDNRPATEAIMTNVQITNDQ